MARVVCLSFPLAADRPEIGEIRSLGFEVATARYLEDGARRNARGAMSVEEIGRTAPPLTPEQKEAFASAEVVLALDLPAGVGTFAPRLRWVHCAAAGVEHFRGSTLGDVIVTNSSGIAATSMSEFVIGKLLAVWKRFDEITEAQRARRWEPSYGRTFRGSVVGIVGVGAIGSAVARLAKTLGATVLGVRRSGRPVEHVDEMFTPDRLHEMLARSDAVIVAATGGDETRKVFDRRTFAAMKEGAVFCNVARGSIVDEAALVEALEQQRLSAAILDVFVEEPLPAESPLWLLPGSHVSAHCSVSLDRYGDDVMELFLDNLRRYAAGKPLRNVVE